MTTGRIAAKHKSPSYLSLNSAEPEVKTSVARAGALILGIALLGGCEMKKGGMASARSIGKSGYLKFAFSDPKSGKNICTIEYPRNMPMVYTNIPGEKPDSAKGLFVNNKDWKGFWVDGVWRPFPASGYCLLP